MISAKEASEITKVNVHLKETLTSVETEILTSARRGYGVATISFVNDEEIYFVYRTLQSLGYVVKQSKVRNDKGNYNLSVAWE